MIALVQRVQSAKLFIKEADFLKEQGAINSGIVVYLGIEKKDSDKDLDHFVNRIVNLRLFEDIAGKMAFSVKDRGLEAMIIPNFTLCADTSRGNRPSFDNAKDKDQAKELFSSFIDKIKPKVINAVPGIFGARMVIKQENFGPVNIVISG